MAKFLGLFMIIFICASHAQNEELNPEIIDRYFQILLKKWQDSAGEHKQEHYYMPPGLTATEARKIKKEPPVIMHANLKAIKEHYGVKVESYTQFVRGEGGEFNIILARLSEKEQIWVLTSNTSGKVLSMHKEPANGLSNMDYQSRLRYYEQAKAAAEDKRTPGKKLDDRYYKELLETWEERKYITERRLITDFLPWRRLKILESIQDYNYNMNIDFATAVTIALLAVAELDNYNHKMIFFEARFMGYNKEYLVVYCFPDKPLPKEEQEICHRIRIDEYIEGVSPIVSRHTSCFNCSNNLPKCPRVYHVLISRENGQVLSIR